MKTRTTTIKYQTMLWWKAERENDQWVKVLRHLVFVMKLLSMRAIIFGMGYFLDQFNTFPSKSTFAPKNISAMRSKSWTYNQIKQAKGWEFLWQLFQHLYYRTFSQPSHMKRLYILSKTLRHIIIIVLASSAEIYYLKRCISTWIEEIK